MTNIKLKCQSFFPVLWHHRNWGSKPRPRFSEQTFGGVQRLLISYHQKLHSTALRKRMRVWIVEGAQYAIYKDTRQFTYRGCVSLNFQHLENNLRPLELSTEPSSDKTSTSIQKISHTQMSSVRHFLPIDKRPEDWTHRHAIWDSLCRSLSRYFGPRYGRCRVEKN